MKRYLLPAVIILAACGQPDGQTPPLAPADRGRKVNPTFVDYEFPGPNLYFFCDGTVGVYMTEGANGDSGKSAAPAVLADHPACAPG